MRFVNFCLGFVFLIFLAIFIYYSAVLENLPHGFYFSSAMMIAIAFVCGLANGKYKTEQRLKEERVES